MSAPTGVARASPDGAASWRSGVAATWRIGVAAPGPLHPSCCLATGGRSVRALESVWMHGLPAARVAVGLKRRSQSELPAPLPLPFRRAGSPGTVGTARCPSRSTAAGLGAAGATTSVRRLARRGGCWRAAGSLATAPAVSLQHLWPMRGGLVPRITYCVTLSPHCPAPGPGYSATTRTHHRAGASVLAFLSSPNLKGPGTPTATRRPRHRRGWDAAGRHPSRAPGSLAVARTALPHCRAPGACWLYLAGRTAAAPTGDASADSELHGGPPGGRTYW